MDHLAAAEERLVSERVQQKLHDINIAAKEHLSPIQDHVNFTLQERLSRSLMVCQDKYEAAKVQKKPGAMNDLESCVEQSTQDGIKMLPHLGDRLKASFSISG
ncbi:protein FAM136A-like [Fagus crenata]